jgi:copper homeostasis protein
VRILAQQKFSLPLSLIPAHLRTKFWIRKPMAGLTLEICVDTPQGVVAASAADRIELCSALALGGLTPSEGLIEAAASSPLPVHAMIRPRAGDFVFDDSDMAACLADIARMRDAGLDGVVVGAAKSDGTLDETALARMVDAAGPLCVTLHRVIDTTPDPVAAVEVAVGLGINRILTSGAAHRVGEGTKMIQAMVSVANGRIEIMAGGGLRVEDVAILRRIGVDAIHASCGTRMKARGALETIGLPVEQTVTDPTKIEQLRHEMKLGEAV